MQSDVEGIMESLDPLGQEHLREWLASGSQGLKKDLESLDPDELGRQLQILNRAGEKIPPAGGFSPAPVVALPTTPQEEIALIEAGRSGRDVLRRGAVAVATVAGGHGTRFGYDRPKGCYPITPLRGKSFFQWHAERILASSRRFGVSLPWYIMTSRDTDAETREFFMENEFFGLQKADVFFMVQASLPLLDRRGRLLLRPDGRLLTGPDGHGGLLNALRASGALDDVRRRGVSLLSYFQVDNVLARPVDPVFIGLHVENKAGASCKVVRKASPEEGLGLLVEHEGKTCVLEYMEAMQNDVAYLTDPSGSLRYWMGSIAIHVFSVDLLERLAGEVAGLPYHVSEKQMSFIAPGEKAPAAEPDGRPVLKFEKFIFDVLPLAESVEALEVERREEFSPVKRPEGRESPQTARSDMMAEFGRWLKRAGVSVPEGAEVEIGPLFALDEQGLLESLDRSKRLQWPLVLD